MNNANPARWFEIYVQDMERARRFYESVFDVTLERLDTPIEIFSFPMKEDGYGCGGALVKMSHFAPSPFAEATGDEPGATWDTLRSPQQSEGQLATRSTAEGGRSVGGGGTIIYFGCEDCAVEAEKAARAGGQIHKPKMSIGQYGFISLVTDTEGNMIGLHSLK